MVKILVDGLEQDMPAEYTLLQVCEELGIEIPRFCFHERLSVAGNCRMCLVEVQGNPKPVASCAWMVKECRPAPGQSLPQIFTDSPMVKKARGGVMEFLLINHPLDCPICDQGGECDLQDQAMAFGKDSSRFWENKRAVEDKYLGPIIRTSMNRCIHCTRCVRFIAEVAGVGDLGAVGRGEDMEITTYLEAAMGSELQGNIADLCPVGALLQKPTTFRARPWEYVKTESIDVMDALGSSIRVDRRGREVMRILPRLHEEVNEEWISDKSRHIVDGLKLQRLDRPFARKEQKLQEVSWGEAFFIISDQFKKTTPDRIAAIAGDLAGVEEMFALKELLHSLNIYNLECRQDGSHLHPAWGRSSYIFNPTIVGIEEADSLLIIGSDPRKEAPVLNARIRKRWRRGDFPIHLIGVHADLTYPYEYLGAEPQILLDFLQDSESARKIFGEKPIFLIGQGALARTDGAALLSLVAELAFKKGALQASWNGLGVLHSAASRVGGLDIEFVPSRLETNKSVLSQLSQFDVIFLLGADEIEIPPGPFVVYQGTHGDRGAHRADIILPGAAYTEKSATYVNTEGRIQRTEQANFPPGQAKEDWSIIRALSEVLGPTLPFDTLASLRQKLEEHYPVFKHLENIPRMDSLGLEALLAAAGRKTALASLPLKSNIEDFYLTNPIARASSVMAEASRIRARRQDQPN